MWLNRSARVDEVITYGAQLGQKISRGALVNLKKSSVYIIAS